MFSYFASSAFPLHPFVLQKAPARNVRRYLQALIWRLFMKVVSRSSQLKHWDMVSVGFASLAVNSYTTRVHVVMAKYMLDELINSCTDIQMHQCAYLVNCRAELVRTGITQQLIQPVFL